MAFLEEEYFQKYSVLGLTYTLNTGQRVSLRDFPDRDCSGEQGKVKTTQYSYRSA